MTKFVHHDFLFEIFEDIADSETQNEAAGKLKHYNETLAPKFSRVMRDILKGALDPQIFWLLPSGTPPYTPCDDKQVPYNIFNKWTPKAIGWFLATNRAIQPKQKREKLYLDILETIHPKDAKILANMIAKKVDYKHLTPTVVRLAFGDNFFEDDRQNHKAA